MKHYTTYVPPRGNDKASIMVVGEAPGADEEDSLAPFVGRAGQFALRYMERAGIPEDDVFFTNVCKYRPHGNKFANLLNTDVLKDGLAELREEVKFVDPNIIIALGKRPSMYLTAEPIANKGITTFRGSTFPAKSTLEGYKVYCTFHPAYLVRPAGYKWNPIFLIDLKRAFAESHTKELPWPDYELVLNPPDSVIVNAAKEATHVTIDIETFEGNTLACVGFSFDGHTAYVVTYEKGFHIIHSLMRSDIPKVFQYGNFDIQFMEKFAGIETRGYTPSEGVGWDTYIASASILPSFPRSLGFLNSIYCRFPYYKEDRKEWKEKGDLNIYWDYNAKDVIATNTVMVEQRRDLMDMFGETYELGERFGL